MDDKNKNRNKGHLHCHSDQSTRSIYNGLKEALRTQYLL